MNEPHALARRPRTRTELWSLLLLLLVAAGLRLYRLPELPLGLHYDEAANAILAGEIAQGGKTPLFIPSYTGKEVLFFYWTALWMRLLGVTPLALRISAALVGVATVAATVWAVREILHDRRGGPWIALLTAAFVATSFWHLILSRYGFRAITQPLMQALTVATLWRGLRHTPRAPSPKGSEGTLWLVLAGLLCGLTAYTYTAARLFPVPLAAALLVLLVTARRNRRARLGQLALFAATAALALAPLAHYWLTHPGSFLTRAGQVAAATWAEAWDGFRACLGMFFLRGDPTMRFNLPFRPLLDPVTAGLFLLGLVALPAARPRKGEDKPETDHLSLASRVFLLTALPVMLLPSALATGDVTPNNLRVVGLLPFVYVFPALGLWTVVDAAWKALPLRLQPPAARLLPAVSCLLILILSGSTTARAYFGHWASSGALYYAADGDMVDVAAYLNQADLSAKRPYVASIHYRHPTLALLAEEYDRVRWLTAGSTLVFPAQPAEVAQVKDALLIFPRSASSHLDWLASVLPEETLVAAPEGPDGKPAFHAYRAGPALDLHPTRPLTANLSHAVTLLGYDVVGQPRSGESAEVAVWWRVESVPGPGVYGPVARLVDPWGFVWGEQAPFHYPSEQWTPGEVVVDHLSIPVAPGAPPGDYLLRFGFYTDATDSLLLVLDEAGRYAGTFVELPVPVAPAAEAPDPAELGIRARLDARVGAGLTLLGHNLDTSIARPGEPLYLTLFWQAAESPLPDYEVTLTLGDAILYRGDPAHGTYPTSRWTAGQIVADRYDPRLPRDMPPGDHPLELQGGDTSLDLGIVVVQATDRVFEIPSISHPLSATLGNQVELLGYDPSAETISPGDTLTLTLYWRALAEMDEDYTVFTHLVGPDGSMTGQRDNPPLGGTYPTSLWLGGEIVADVYEIPVRADAPPGEHRLEVGMYVAETGTRLPVAGTPDDAILLQTVSVAE